MPTKQRRKIAIACQGGGSQTAFTAGALEALFEHHVQDDFQIVSLSGTSGGALCATLLWYALMKGDANPTGRLMAFWRDNMAQTPAEQQFNHQIIESLRATSKGHLPHFNISPSDPLAQWLMSLSTSALRPEFTDFPLLLRKHFDFDELLRWGAQPDAPALLLGAAEVLSGKLRKFNSRDEPIRIEHLLSSCAVPNIFPAVEFEGFAYWDGLFSDNPPVNELVRPKFVGDKNVPDELWIIKINPTGCDEIPQSAEAISDRRNEMVGNVSLFQQLDTLAWLNDLILHDAFRPEVLAKFDIRQPVLIPKCYVDQPDAPYTIPFIEMSAELTHTLDYESKLDRSPENLGKLMADGRKQASAFLTQRRKAVHAK
ncbi:patatin-like phospholipase family protein [Chitinilyticum piscinae]|uniref:Patatin-like phospholipase family protein n=1 Tax=Chitinilyticum piscinae TaxID=2866724 RepID=A0A8J7FU20_9NEIS|nr:patatin-like phospholipase family protein [Chitinilyticum piscinae]MBE9610581.1 patatin-like phospholipase family protein [Chitinilyticum piscinae]